MADLLESIGASDEDAMKDRFLTFLIDAQTYGIEIRNVMEIVGIQPITRLPETPVYIPGVINLRGMITPVMDIRLRFKRPAQEYNDRTCVIVTKLGGLSIGMIVDSVSDVLTIPDKDISEKPEFGIKCGRGYIRSIAKIGEKVVLLIDCEKLLNEEELDMVKAQL